MRWSRFHVDWPWRTSNNRAGEGLAGRGSSGGSGRQNLILISILAFLSPSIGVGPISGEAIAVTRHARRNHPSLASGICPGREVDRYAYPPEWEWRTDRALFPVRPSLPRRRRWQGGGRRCHQRARLDQGRVRVRRQGQTAGRRDRQDWDSRAGASSAIDGTQGRVPSSVTGHRAAARNRRGAARAPRATFTGEEGGSTPAETRREAQAPAQARA